MIDLIQGSQEWLNARAGSIGASQIADALAKTKSGWGASRANIHARMVTERITGKPVKTFVSGAMQRGTELEPEARNAYSFLQGHDVVEIGMVPHPRIAKSHCSPDGLIGDDGLVELKCCEAPRHIELLRGSPPEDRYIKQCLWQMACTERQWCDLAYYNPDFPVEMQLHVFRIDRDDAAIAELEAGIDEFLNEVSATVADLENTYRKAA